MEIAIAASQASLSHSPSRTRSTLAEATSSAIASIRPQAWQTSFRAYLIWMHEEPMLPGRQYFLKIGASTVVATMTSLKYKVNINTLERLAAKELELNEIGVCNLGLDRQIPFDPYTENRSTGSFIVIDFVLNTNEHRWRGPDPICTPPRGQHPLAGAGG